MSSKAKRRRKVPHSVVPYLTVRKPADLIDFLKQSFKAKENLRTTGSAGGMHAEVKIGDSIVMLGGRARIKPMTAAIHLYVPDIDKAFARALAAGGVSLFDPADQPYGERSGAIKDPTGNRWYIATPFYSLKEIHPNLRTVTLFFHAIGAKKFIRFLVKAFEGEQVMRHEQPRGVVAHAKVRLGDSIVELGEAHDKWQPTPTAAYLFVDNVDETRARALKAGATSMREPSWVKDPWGNVWYLAPKIT